MKSFRNLKKIALESIDKDYDIVRITRDNIYLVESGEDPDDMDAEINIWSRSRAFDDWNILIGGGVTLNQKTMTHFAIMLGVLNRVKYNPIEDPECEKED